MTTLAQRNKSKRRHQTKHIARLIYISNIKTQRGCIDCGYNNNPIALDFDHQGSKIDNVAHLVNICASWDRINTEISKCQVVCANCHRIRTIERRGTFRGLPITTTSRNYTSPSVEILSSPQLALFNDT